MRSIPSPTFSKVSHISFSVRDAATSAEWWRDVFGLVDVERVHGEGWHGILLIHTPTATILEFQQHDANQGERFDPVRTGFDHLGFKVDTPEQLDEWQSHFEQNGVTHTPVAQREYGSVLTFKDPDGIQFEMFYRHAHP
jgi:glyoxylase I family protein